MLTASALQRLTHDLAALIASMGLSAGGFGKPELVEEAARAAEQLFQGYTKSKPDSQNAYAAARAFVRGQTLDAWQRDQVACAVSEPIREHAGTMVLASRRFAALLAAYQDEVERGELWLLTWHGLLYSYFNFDPTKAKDAAAREGWQALRSFLERTWPWIDRQEGTKLVRDWVRTLRDEAHVLTDNPVEKYTNAYLHGETEPTDRLASELGIPASSWFWHDLVIGAVICAARAVDAGFQRWIPQLIDLIQGKPGCRDEALEIILTRYHACKGAPAHEQLRDFVCQPTVWKNPKLKAAGIATAWNRVPDPVWQMVLAWVNERNLQDFFDLLAARNNADEGRLLFWSRYLKQISWTRLVFGADTMALQKTNQGVRELIVREEGAYAQFTGKSEADAFMMQLGAYTIIEFSKKPNACHVYHTDQLPFDRYARHYDGSTSDLKARNHIGCKLRIVHRDGWDAQAERELRQLGISPDVGMPLSGSSVTTDRTSTSANPGHGSKSPKTATPAPDLTELHALLARFPGAVMDDQRKFSGAGRLWIKDPRQRALLAVELKALGFKWAQRRQRWYLPEH